MRRYGLWAMMLAGCATAGTGAGERAEYTGQPFAVTASGGEVSGQVCGMDVQYAVARDGDALRLDGYLDARVPSRIEIRSGDAGARRITGTLGTEAGASVVDLVLEPGRLRGRVGFREFNLVEVGGALRGPMVVAGVAESSQATVNGAAELHALPPEVQAAVLPSLLTCFVAPLGMRAVSPLVVGVGGKAGSLPRQSSSIYSRR